MRRPMKALLTQLFRPVVDSEAATRRHLLWWILLRMVLMSILCISAAILRDSSINAIVPPLPQTSLFLLTLYAFALASAFFLQKTLPSGWQLRAFGLGQLCADALFVAVFVYATGCSFSIFAPLFILPIIAAGLILYKAGSLFLAAISTILYAVVLTIEISGPIPGYFAGTGYEPPVRFAATLNLFAFYGLLFFLSALISGQMGSRLHRTQQQLRKTTRAYDQLAQLYQQIFDDISTGIITTDAMNRINSYNQAAADITGYSRDLVMGEQLERFFPSLTQRSPTESARNACDFIKAGGEAIRIGYSSARLHLTFEKDGSGGDSMAKVITLQDISQVERMEKQMREAEKLAAIGEMSAMVAHDFRNPLAAISGSAQMLAMNQDSSGSTTSTLVGIILRESERMEKTIADFLLFARPKNPQQEWFELHPVLGNLIEHFIRDNERFAHAVIELDIPEGLSCWADQQQLVIMLHQLVENACVAAQDTAKKVVVRARKEHRATGDWLEIEVCDQGPGIASELRERVFTPFFSHHSQGTGLGLAIVRLLTQLHGGTVSIHDGVDFNCIVRLLLPQPGQSEFIH